MNSDSRARPDGSRSASRVQPLRLPIGGTAQPDRVAGLVTALTMVVGFGTLIAGFEYFWLAFPIGFGVVLPLAVAHAGGAGREDGSATASDADEALSTLRRRYARGELTEQEFERRVTDLLETESLEAASSMTDDAADRDRGSQVTPAGWSDRE